MRPFIPQRWAHVANALLLSALMSLIVSGIATLNALGWVDGMFAAWMQSWGSSWVVAFPAILFVAPIVRRIVTALTVKESLIE